MARLFHRVAAVTIAKPRAFFSQEPNGIIIRKLRTAFSVEKTSGKEPNSCDLTIWNMSDASRSLLDQKPVYIRLEAGYDNEEELLFEGDMLWSESVKTDADWETKILVRDGHRAIRQARVNRSFRGMVRKRDVVREIVSSMGAFVSSESLNRITGSYANGIVLDGKAEKKLTEVLNTVNRTWSIQNGVLQILEEGETLRTQAVVIQQDKGMIGSPSFGAPPEKGKPPTLSVLNQLYPSLAPGMLALVTSREIKGQFKIKRAIHQGDTHGQQWETMIEANPR